MIKINKYARVKRDPILKEKKNGDFIRKEKNSTLE